MNRYVARINALFLSFALVCGSLTTLGSYAKGGPQTAGDRAFDLFKEASDRAVTSLSESMRQNMIQAMANGQEPSFSDVLRAFPLDFTKGYTKELSKQGAVKAAECLTGLTKFSQPNHHYLMSLGIKQGINLALLDAGRKTTFGQRIIKFVPLVLSTIFADTMLATGTRILHDVGVKKPAFVQKFENPCGVLGVISTGLGLLGIPTTLAAVGSMACSWLFWKLWAVGTAKKRPVSSRLEPQVSF